MHAGTRVHHALMHAQCTHALMHAGTRAGGLEDTHHTRPPRPAGPQPHSSQAPRPAASSLLERLAQSVLGGARGPAAGRIEGGGGGERGLLAGADWL